MFYYFLPADLIKDAEKTEACISVLLDTSVRHSPHFDWVVAHIGGCFPDTVINRVLTVGLKDFCQHAEIQVTFLMNSYVFKVSKISEKVMRASPLYTEIR